MQRKVSHVIEIDRRAHTVALLDRMKDMMLEESMCDFTIKVGSKEIKAHRLVLAGASDYFRLMIMTDDEDEPDFVNFDDVDFECMKICLDFIYNNNVSIPLGKYEDLLYVANKLQLNRFCDYIYAKLYKELDSQLFFAIRRIADTYGRKELEEKCVKFAEENFVSISKQDGFRDLDMEYVHKIISSKNVKMTEEEKLDVVLRFINVEKKRKKHLEEMIAWVDVDKISLERREEMTEHDPLVNDNLKVYKIFVTSLTNTLKEQLGISKAKVASKSEIAGSRRQQTSGLQVAQNSPASAIQLGAACHESNIALYDEVNKHLQRFNSRDNTMAQTEMLGGTKGIFSRYSSIAVDDYVCVLMGQKFRRFKYSDATSPWKQMPDMICDHGPWPPVTATMGCMYVCGGSFTIETVAFEKFDLSERNWERLKDKPRASSNSAVLASNENVYSIGGKVDGGATNRVDRFNIASSTWAEIAPMKYARSVAAAVEANESIFVLGGWFDGGALDKVEKYCVSSNQWTEIKPMQIARCWFKAFAIDGTIYAVGGWNSAAKGNIEKYKVEGVE